MGQTKAEAHSFSLVFTGAIYDILADMAQIQTTRTWSITSGKIDANSSRKIAHHLLVKLVGAYLNAPYQNATLRDVAHNLVNSETDPQIQASMLQHFTEREVMDGSIYPMPYTGHSYVDKSCGTLKKAFWNSTGNFSRSFTGSFNRLDVTKFVRV